MMAAVKWWPAAVAVLALAAGWAWLSERDDRMRAQGRAAVADSIIEVVRDSIVQLETNTARADSLARVAGARADSAGAVARAAFERAQVVAETAARQRREVIDSVVAAAASDSTLVREAIAPVVASYEAELSVVRAALLTSRAHAQSLKDALAASWSTREALEAENTALRTLAAEIENARRLEAGGRSWVERVGERLLWTGLGAAVGVVGVKVLE